MPLRITIDAYSGLPNPTVTIGDREAAGLLERLRPDKRQSAKQLPEVPQSILGYRGLLFEQTGDRAGGLPAQFRLAGGLLTGTKLRHIPSDELVEDFICGSTGPFVRTDLTIDELDGIRRMIPGLRQIDWPIFDRPIKWPVRPSCPCAPLYEPDWWNDPVRQPANNCYNYGTNYRTDTFAQPGRATGHLRAYPPFCSDCRDSAVSDGLIDSPNADNKCPSEGHLVALVVAPGPGFVDFHWYRKGRNGRWTHKPGPGAATNLDNSAHTIPDPRTADRGPYTDFCTFMTVMHGHTKIT
jgi:hypothetical protein